MVIVNNRLYECVREREGGSEKEREVWKFTLGRSRVMGRNFWAKLSAKRMA